MEYSSRFGFYLPSKDGDDIADINQISNNFRIIDEEMVTNEDVKEVVDTKANLEFVSLEIEELVYVGGLKEGAHIYELKEIIEAGSSGAYELHFTDGTHLITSAHDSFKVGKKYLISATLNPETGYIFDIVAEVIDLEDKVNIEDIDQHFDPTSPNAQSGIAIEERLKSKVLLDVTLTEEQAGVSSVMVEIPNYELLKKAKYWNVRISHPYTEVLPANAIWYNVVIADKDKAAYNITLAAEDNIALATTNKYVHFNIIVFNSPYSWVESRVGTLLSVYQSPTPWTENSSANTRGNLFGTSFHYDASFASDNKPPYLEFYNSSNFIFEAGTRIYLEVIL